jgi:hypothetical protein
MKKAEILATLVTQDENKQPPPPKKKTLEELKR